jgi:hypothetical protein
MLALWNIFLKPFWVWKSVKFNWIYSQKTKKSIPAPCTMSPLYWIFFKVTKIRSSHHIPRFQQVKVEKCLESRKNHLWQPSWVSPPFNLILLFYRVFLTYFTLILQNLAIFAPKKTSSGVDNWYLNEFLKNSSTVDDKFV